MQQMHSPEQAAVWLRARVQAQLQSDSRRVQTGDAFFAWAGQHTDARHHVVQALQQGASACLVEADGLEAFEALNDLGLHDAPIVSYQGLKAASGAIADAYFEQPSQQMQLIAVTGTNGKTSTAWWLAQALTRLGQRCTVVGTLGLGEPGQMHSTGLTTPDPLQLQTQLRRWVNEGVKACAMEASSIGLVEHRLNGCHIRTAILTNFTQDHLDYHGDMQTYWQAKQSLFEWPGLATAVINWDDPKGQALCEMLASTPVQVWTVSMHSTQANVYARHVRTTAQGMEFEVVCGEQSQSVSSQCVGEFNVMNMLGVMAVLCQAGHRLSAVVDACHALQPVPGRMQTWGRVGTPAVVVDYAHTPDAVAKALQALRPWAHARGGRLYCVLGSGGDRDSSKRAPMGRSAEAHADQVCLTSDNPRSEDPQHIVQQMLAGMTQPHKAIQQLDRAKAISDSIAQAQAADVVLVAGKGHETYQEVLGQKLPFSDSDHVVLALQRWGYA
ncbi:MAG: UDP-N-acetylmuramoyl-L-alanyl-D-glutamate--2,6-diaminopimelate ligase [Burkholderiales bacterium]